MIKNLRKYTNLSLASVFVGSFGLMNTAEASTFYLGNGFNFPEVASEFNYVVDGIGLKTTGLLDGGGSRNVYRSILGAGVTNQVIFDFEDNQIDGLGIDETLVLEFDRTVDLKSITFARVGINDEFTLTVDGDGGFSADIPGGNFLDLDISTFVLNPSRIGINFGIGVTDRNDDFLVKYVEVEAIPEPLTILGTLTALGFGGLFKKKISSKMQ